MFDTLLSQIADMLQSNMWFAPILALLAGILTSFTPCCLSTIPLIIGYVGGVGETNPKRAFVLSSVFALGSAITFTVLGIIASTAGRLLGHASSIWYLVLGILMVLMSLQIWEIFNFIPSSNLIAKNTKKGLLGAFLAGILGGVFATPCSTPVLVALLAIVAGQGSLVWGIILMLLYSVGHSTLVLIAGTSVGFVQKLKNNNNYKTAAFLSRVIMGTIILIIGLYMFWQAF